jgi:DNA-binding winged helix-turn-helix (wHTH) protein/TolB-like protein/Tfp pilus assembly protein PilF
MHENPQTLHRFYSFGPFCVDTARLLLYRDGRPVPLAPRFVRALLLLVQNQGLTLSKDYLMDELWPDTAVEENNLTVIISALRKLFGDDPGQHRYIVTIPGRGYRFVAVVTESSTQPPSIGDAPDAQTLALGSRKERLVSSLQNGKRSRMQVAWIIAAVVLASALLLGIWAKRGWTTAKASTVHNLAVLPFESVGFGSDDEYLGLGMADSLAARLHNFKHIYVKPIGDVLTYQNSAYDPRALGRMLDVSELLTGTVQKSGERINVNIRLLRVSDTSVLWSEEFTGEIKQILAIQDHIADRVAYALTLNPRAEAKRDAQRRYTQNPEAYQLYLHGQYFLNHRSRSGVENDLNKAVAYFQQALEKDHQFALAYAALAGAYNKLSWYVSAEDSYAKAEAAAQKALGIDDKLPEAYRSLALAKQAYEWNFTAADAAYRRAIELDPDEATTHRWYADELIAIGRNQEAENEWRRAQQLDPYAGLYDTLGHVYFYSRRYKDAYLELQGKQDVDPDAFWYLAWIYSFHRGELSGSNASPLSGPIGENSESTSCKLAYASAATAKRRGLEACLRSLQKGAGSPDVSPYNIALLYVALKDTNSAFDWLNRARQAHTWNLMYVRVDPRLDTLRGDPRFDSLLASMGLQR